MTKARLKGAAAFVFGMSLAAMPWQTRVRHIVELEGHVYDGLTSNRIAGDPAVGAVVSTSLSSTTAVTDQDGYFHLHTGAHISGDEYYTITVQSAGRVFRQRATAAPVRGSDFVLATPTRIHLIYPPSDRFR
jgi:phosphatidate phosphatase APP1